jgi:hypothetical protein
LAHVVLKERLHTLGIVGCVLCIVGSTTIVLHAPMEQTIDSVEKVWGLATEPGVWFPPPPFSLSRGCLLYRVLWDASYRACTDVWLHVFEALEELARYMCNPSFDV